MFLFGVFLPLDHEGAKLPAASCGSDVTDSGLDLIPPLAARRPQGNAPPPGVKINLQVWKYLRHPRKKNDIKNNLDIRRRIAARGVNKHEAPAEES